MRFVREERENDQQTRRTKREKRRKKCRKNLEIWKTNRRGFFFLHFFPPLSCLVSSPSEVLRFLFEGKTSFFVGVLCIALLRDIKNTPLTLCCNTILMGVLRVKGKDLISRFVAETLSFSRSERSRRARSRSRSLSLSLSLRREEEEFIRSSKDYLSRRSCFEISSYSHFFSRSSQILLLKP